MKRPDPIAIDLPKPDLTDDQIGKAIQNGVDFVLRQFDPHTHLLNDITTENNSYSLGTDPLAVVDIPHMCHGEGHTVDSVTSRDGCSEFALRAQSGSIKSCSTKSDLA